MNRPDFLLAIVFIALVSFGCAKKSWIDAEGFGGSDPVVMALKAAQTRTANLLSKFKDGTLDSVRLCDPRRCKDPESEFCSPLVDLPEHQRQYAVETLVHPDHLDALISFLKTAEFKVEEEVLLDGVSVDARVAIGGGPIHFSRKKVSESSPSEMISLWVHEAFHTFPFEGEEEPVLDDSTYAYGYKGYELLNVLGRCVAVAENDLFIDKRDKIAVYSPSLGWYIDSNRNFGWDGGLGDAQVSFGPAGGLPVSGDFNNDGFDEIAIFTAADGKWYVDMNGDLRWGEGDVNFQFGPSGSYPAVGDFDGDGKDEIAAYVPSTSTWYLDWNNNFRFDAEDRVVLFGFAGTVPAVGDFNGDGRDEIAIYANDSGAWYIDTNNDFGWNYGDRLSYFGGPGSRGIALDLDGDGKDELAAYEQGTGSWYFDNDGNHGWDGGIADRLGRHGFGGTYPVTGNWR